VLSFTGVLKVPFRYRTLPRARYLPTYLPTSVAESISRLDSIYRARSW